MANMLGILNQYAVDSGYAGRLGEITQDNLNNITRNYNGKDLEGWLNLTNQIAATYVRSMEYDRTRNPFASFYREPLAVGNSVREIWVDVAQGYDMPEEGTARGEIASVKPNVAETFYNINYKMQYKITYSEDQIRGFFRSLNELNSLNSQVMNSVYTAAEYDNFLSDTQVLGTALYQGGMVTKEVASVSDQSSAQAFMKTLKTTIDTMRFANRIYNAAGFLMTSRPEDLVLVITPDVLNTISVDWLAGVFNLSKVEMNTRIILVPKEYGFGTTTDSNNVVAILMDKRFLHIQEQLYTTSVNFVHGPRYYNMFHTQTFIKSYGAFAPCVAFVSNAATATISGGVTTADKTAKPGSADTEVAISVSAAGTPLYLEFATQDTGTFADGSHAICTYIDLPANTATSKTVAKLKTFPWKNCSLVTEKKYSRDKQTSQHWLY